MRHHYVPQVYLRQWCENGTLIRYRRVGPPGSLRLLPEPKSPAGIYWGHNLNTLPEGVIANGMTGDEIEHLLARRVDEAVLPIVEAAAASVGGVDVSLGERVKWLMQTFVARSPDAIAAIEAGASDFARRHESLIHRTLAAAMPPEMRTALLQYLDPRMPAVAARAALANIVAAQHVPMRGWYEGTVHILHVERVMAGLQDLGLSEFPTYEDPVVQWVPNAAGLIASFSLSPGILACVCEGSAEDEWDLARRHVVTALCHRQSAICRRAAMDGRWLAEAENLLPWGLTA